MVNQLKKGAMIILFIGLIGVALNLIFGYGTVHFINREKLPNTYLWIYKYDFNSYITNLNNTIGNTVPLQLTLPPHEWITTGDIVTVFANNMKVIGDYIIMILNILMYPLRVGAYGLINFLALLGVNTSNIEGSNINWLVQTIQGIYNIQIPYIA